MPRYENGQSTESIEFIPAGLTADGKKIYEVFPGPGELPDYEQIVAEDREASTGTPRRQAPLEFDEFNRPIGRSWNNRHSQ